MGEQMRVRPTGDWAHDLLAAIVQRAVIDAQRPDRRGEEAVEWLDSVWPTWRRWQMRSQGAAAQNGQESTKPAYLV